MNNNYFTNRSDVIIVGGGLAGLTAATYLARAGRSVTLLEKAKQLGGRATTQIKESFHFNLGPHALYLDEGVAILNDLEIPFTGNKPPLAGYNVVYRNQRYPFPMTAGAVMQCRLFKLSDRLRMLKIFANILQTNPEKVAHLSVQEWVERQTPSPEIRAFLYGSARVATYANIPELASTAVFLQQTQLSIKDSVLYLDYGWQSLVDGLRQAAVAAGTKIVTGARVDAVSEQKLYLTVDLADGTSWQGAAVLLAVDPETAARLLPDQQYIQQAAKTAVPVRAACLDIGLRRLPSPENTFALGLDTPLYYSVHSAAAKLAPAGSATIQVAKYLPAGPSDLEQDRRELESYLDLAQPGWRRELIAERFLPEVVVVTRLATAAEWGRNGRPAVTLPNSTRLYLAGDWVGPRGWLADASFASAKTAAQHILTRTNSLLEDVIMRPAFAVSRVP
jgi:phytoene dehydrogenase-like protein